MTAASTQTWWQWLLARPLSGPMRGRLEIAFGVVVTSAAVVGLSTFVRPDPAKLAARTEAAAPPVISDAELRAEAHLRAEAPPPPKVAPELVAAVAHGDIATMDRLFKPGMALDGLLATAAEQGEEAALRWLLDHGANVHEDEGSIDALVLVADAHPTITQLLLDRGAAETTLAKAASAGAPNAVTRLIAAHAPVKAPDVAPLVDALSSTRATTEQRATIVDMLLAAGADPNGSGSAGIEGNALTAAVRTCEVPAEPRTAPADCVPLMKLLVKKGARARADAILAALWLDESLRDTTLDVVLSAPLEPGATATALAQSWNDDPAIFRRLRAKGIDWAWHDGEDDAALPLLAAVQRGNRDGVRMLLDAGAPADMRFKDGSCVLCEALDGLSRGNAAEYARIVELLVTRGADVNRRLPDGRTPLFAAAESGDLRTVNFLLDRGARVNDRVLDDTALDVAEQNGQVPVARALHARGGRRARKSPTFDP